MGFFGVIKFGFDIVEEEKNEIWLIWIGLCIVLFLDLSYFWVSSFLLCVDLDKFFFFVLVVSCVLVVGGVLGGERWLDNIIEFVGLV